MLKKIKPFLIKLLISTKRFLLAISYGKILMLIIELTIVILILININRVTLQAKEYFDLVKYTIAIIALFALGYAIHKK